MKCPIPSLREGHLPTATGERTPYRAANKLLGKRAIITGGDSGIGAAAALLFAKEGATSTIAYLPEEEEDAQQTKREIEELGQACHLIPIDLVKRENWVVDFAVEKMGGVDILFNNAACRLGVELVSWEIFR